MKKLWELKYILRETIRINVILNHKRDYERNFPAKTTKIWTL